MDPISPVPAFVADMMLGKLARWLRVLGWDVLYFNPVEDRELIEIARRTSRIVLTRDTRLVKRRNAAPYLLVARNDPREQVAEVIRRYPPDRERFLSRCLLCNTPLMGALKREVENEVPDYVYHRETLYGRCPECRRVFWRGSHYGNMLERCLEYAEIAG
ncbi:MAG: Mut7-C RNAse domain-containing protein [bacterium]|nr:Mut7-C RNAse domain-containing protein [bacterium]